MPKRDDRPEPGIFKKGPKAGDPDIKVLDYSYTGDGLPQVIARAWADEANNTTWYQNLMSQKHNLVKACLADYKVYLRKPIVITEAEYKDGWLQDDDEEVVLVLPDSNRTDPPNTNPPPDLLETAKALMACTPHGI